jgi:5-methylcytosine-specific restriction endonuclease McrA
MKTVVQTVANQANEKFAYLKYSIRREVFIRDDFQCQSCGKQFKKPQYYNGRKGISGLTLGHVIPKMLGGKFIPANLRAQCIPCQEKLGNKIWETEVRRYLTNYDLKRVYCLFKSEISNVIKK